MPESFAARQTVLMVFGWMDEWTDGSVDGWMDGWMDGWVGECVGGWVGEWTDGNVHLVATGPQTSSGRLQREQARNRNIKA